MKKAAAVILSLIMGLILVSCGKEEDASLPAEIEGYKAEIARLEEENIKLKEEISVKESLIKELRRDEDQIEAQATRKQQIKSYYDELGKSFSFMSGNQAYTQQGPFDGGYSVDRGLQTLDKIQSALDSFTDMTALVRERSLLEEEELGSVGNTDEATQIIDFFNMIIRVKGQMMEQNFIIKDLDLRRALALYELGKVERKEVEAKYDDYLDAREQYQDFINRTFYRDRSYYPSPMSY